MARIVALLLMGSRPEPYLSAALASIAPAVDLLVVNDNSGEPAGANRRCLEASALDRDGRVAISVIDHENPYRYIQIRGVVAEKTTNGADEHIDRLAKKYMGLDKYPYRSPADRRVIYKVRPLHVQTMG